MAYRIHTTLSSLCGTPKLSKKKRQTSLALVFRPGVLGRNEPRAAPYDNYKVKKKVIYLPFVKLQGQ
jgi:hypothetical protein